MTDLTDQEATWHSVNRVLDISTRNQLHNHQDPNFLFLTTLFSTLCYPADQQISLTSKVTILFPSPNYQSYLTMLEQALENLAEADQDQVPWTDPGLMDKKTDRDSSLTSSEAELGREELAKLKKHFLSTGEQVSRSQRSRRFPCVFS